MKKNLKKTILLSTMFLMFNNLSLVSQNLNPTYALSAPGSANTFTGGYTFAYVASGTPWNGPLISYGGFSNQYDCQISSDYGPHGGNHISYRTKNGDNSTWNSWNELATRGANDFIGNQNIHGKLDVRNNITLWGNNPSIPEEHGQIVFENTNHGVRRVGNVVDVFTSGGPESGITFTPRAYNGSTGSYSIMNVAMKIAYNGNIGIGTSNPTSKLTVAGNINSREVKVIVDAGADFVFANDYNLPALDAVDKYIKENKHLPEIPSADEMKKDGINLSEMNIKLLQKIEELTLYTIEQQKNTEKLTKVIEALAKRLEVVERK